MLMHRTRSITLMIMAACALGSVARAAPVPRLTPDDVAGINPHKPMRADSIGAVASMTKPITGVAMMMLMLMLYEQGS